MLTSFGASYTYDFTKSFRMINIPSEFTKENLFYIEEIGYLKTPDNDINGTSHPNSFLFFAVICGSGLFQFNGKNYDLKQGDCLFINCNLNYFYKNNEINCCELMWIQFYGKQILPFWNYYQRIHSEGIFHTDYITNFTALIGTCLELVKKNDIIIEFIISKMITDLLTLCITSNASHVGQPSFEKMRLVNEYINMNFQKKISLTTVAQEFYINKHYLAREYKKFYGMTIGDYITYKRITYAKELLRFTNKPIEEISALCGISDTNYFAKVFRKLEECSPRKYRERW